MKKNRTMRTTALLLALVMLTSCFVGGTFAKYVTTGTGSDSARVAKWGVAIEADVDGFANTYATDDEAVASVIANSVVSTDDVVAPGTSGSMGAIALSGTPEVATRVSFEADLSLAGWEVWQEAQSHFEWVLDTEQGWYNGWWREDGSTSTTYSPPDQEITPPTRDGAYAGEAVGKRVFGQRAGTFSIYWWYRHIWTEVVTEAGYVPYCPIVVNVGDTAIFGLDYATTAEFEAAVEAAIAAYSADYAPGTDLSTVAAPSITWAWAFEGNSDANDTALGNAEIPATIALDITVTATQID